MPVIPTPHGGVIVRDPSDILGQITAASREEIEVIRDFIMRQCHGRVAFLDPHVVAGGRWAADGTVAVPRQ
jgi:hypothetical protein